MDKETVVAKVKDLLPSVDEKRLDHIYDLIVLEIESFNRCKNKIDWDKFETIVVEVLYQTAKDEVESKVSSVKRGDTQINYQVTTAVKTHLQNYDELIKRLIGCGGVRFY